MRRFRILFAALFLCLAGVQPARADPITITLAIVGAATWKAAIISSISVAISLGASLLLRKRPKAPGQKLDITIGGDNPLSIGFGKYVTAGQLEYAASWGRAGRTPNAYLTQVIRLSDAPIDGMNAVYVSGERVAFSGAETPQGRPVAQFRTGGADYLWIKFYDGSQAQPDSFLVSQFGSSPRPWTSEFIGRGRAYAIVTMRYNRELFASVPSFRFELRGMKLYDPRKDAAAGGVGAHRENDPATWEYSDNAILIARAILRGVRWQGDWIYGGQTIEPARLPASAWIAAANEEFKAGGEVECDVEPADALEAFMLATGGRIAEIGGIYKPRPAAPEGPVWFFTDDDVIVSDPQALAPFEGLQQRHNRVEASYPEPDEAWTLKPAPARIDQAAVAREKGRELTLPLDLRLVPYRDQVQRLMAQALADTQRQRQHRLALPPIAWLLEPGDAIAWTSARNGYDAKLFRIEEMAGRRSFIQTVALREVEPGDYDWSPGDLIPVETNPIAILRPEPQPMTGFQAFPASYEDPAGNGYPSIELRYETDLEDVRSVRVQVRLAEDASTVFDGELPYASATGGAILNGVFLPDTEYEVRAKFVPFSPRATDWSAWLPIRTPDTRFIAGVPDGSVDLDKLAGDTQDLIRFLAGRARQIEDDARNLHRLVGEMQLEDFEDRRLIREELKVASDNLTAAYANAVFAATGPASAIAGRVETVETGLADAQTGIGVLGSGLSALTTRVDTAEGAVAVNASDIAALQASLTIAEGDITANAGAVAALDVRVTAAEGAITTQASQIATLTSGLSDADTDIAANATAISGVDTRVTLAEGAIAANASSIVSIESSLATAQGDIAANASAVSTLQTRVTDNDGDLSALSQALIGVNAATGGNVANARFGIQAASTPSDALARMALRVAASGGGALSEAGIFLDALSGGQSRVVIAADKFVMQSGLNARYAPFVIDGGVIYMDKARIRDLDADNLQPRALANVQSWSTTIGQGTTSTVFINLNGVSNLAHTFDRPGLAQLNFSGVFWITNDQRTITLRIVATPPSGPQIYLGGQPIAVHTSARPRNKSTIAGQVTVPVVAGRYVFSVQWMVSGNNGAAFERRLELTHFKE